MIGITKMTDATTAKGLKSSDYLASRAKENIMNKLIAGDRVKVFQKPLTGEDFEGNAILMEYLFVRNESEYWNVLFDGDDHIHPRFVRACDKIKSADLAKFRISR